MIDTNDMCDCGECLNESFITQHGDPVFVLHKLRDIYSDDLYTEERILHLCRRIFQSNVIGSDLRKEHAVGTVIYCLYLLRFYSGFFYF